MAIKIRCVCGNIMFVPVSRIGETGHCPSCSRSIKVELSENLAQMIPGDGEQGKISPQKTKKSFVNKLLTVGVYFLFLLLLAGVIVVHTFSVKDLRAIKPQQMSFFASFWDNNRELIIDMKNFHRSMFTFSKNKGNKN